MHYSLFVFEKKGDVREMYDILEPFDENCERYIRFIDRTDDIRRDYKASTREAVVSPSGKIFSKNDENFRYVDDRFYLPEGFKLVDYPTECVMDFETYAREWCGAVESAEHPGRWGFVENPNAKFDWWQFKKFLFNNHYERVIGGRVCDLDFRPSEKDVKIAGRVWDISMGNAPGESKFDTYKPEYLEENFPGRDEFIEFSSSRIPYAILDREGKWVDRDDCKAGTTFETFKRFREEWDKVLRSADPSDYIESVDYHM